MSTIKKIEESELWKKVFELAESIYGIAESNSEDEQWSICFKIRNQIIDINSDIAQSEGAIDPRDVKWLLGKARANMFGLKANYKLGVKIGIFTLEPQYMVDIEKITVLIDKKIDATTEEIKNWNKEMNFQVESSK